MSKHPLNVCMHSLSEITLYKIHSIHKYPKSIKKHTKKKNNVKEHLTISGCNKDDAMTANKIMKLSYLDENHYLHMTLY